jgi:hypothetical protein
MLLYRVFPHLPAAAPGTRGHPDYLHAQGPSRLDNPGHYRVWYFAAEQSGAVGEVFGGLDEWDERMFPFPLIPGSRRALGTYRLDDGTPLLDLDDANNLLQRGLRPTQVIERNRAETQAWALRVFAERNDRGEQVWQGVRWWSFYRPGWRIVGYWGAAEPQPVDVERLGTAHVAVADAAAALSKRIV